MKSNATKASLRPILGRAMLLEIQDLTVAYNRHQVVHGIDLSVQSGELVALLGPNGVGKTTSLLACCGLIQAVKGSIFINDQRVVNPRPAQLVKNGLVLCPQGRELFKSMTVRENLLLGAITRSAQEDGLTRMYDLFPILRQRDRQLAGTLSGGEQQMLAIGRALMAKPRILLIDEPSTGLAPKMVLFVLDLLRTLIPTTVEGVLLVEQNADAALKISDRAYFMEAGLIKMEGTGESLRNNDLVRRMYLGDTQPVESQP